MSRTIMSRIIIAGLFLLFATSSILYIRELKLNNSYNRYETEEMRNDVVGIATSILETDQILHSTLQSGKITIGDANLVGSDFLKQDQDFVNMARREQIQNESQDEKTATASFSMSTYISKGILNASVGDFDLYSQHADQEITLSDKQKTTLKTIEKINDNWAAIVKKDIKVVSGNELGGDFDNYYSHTTYTYWYKMIKDFVNYANKLDMSTIYSLEDA